MRKIDVRNVLMVAAENAALNNGKVGGVGDVIRDIPLYLAKYGIQVDVVVPSYKFLHRQNEAEVAFELTVPFQGDFERVTVYRVTQITDTKVNQWLIDHDLFGCNSRNGIYSDEDEQGPFAFDATKYALFCSAVCVLLKDKWINRVDVIHLHDWHAALVAVIREYDPNFNVLKGLRCVYTIHNIAIQGIRPLQSSDSSLCSWFPMLNYSRSAIADPIYTDCFNPVRAAINLSDIIHVVSPTYVKEVTQPSNHALGFYGGENLHTDLLLANKQHKLVGILNGCQYDDTPTSQDKLNITEFYQQVHNTLLSWMGKNRYLMSSHYIAQLRLATWQQQSMSGPLITSIGRIAEQKFALLFSSLNSDLTLSKLLYRLAKDNGRLVILGSGDKQLEDKLCALMIEHDNLLFLNGYSEKLPTLLYQLGDLFLMPSVFEPCGISQMLAMRQGQLCLVHDVGGLADTVVHGETGFCFSGNDLLSKSQDLLVKFDQALTLQANDNERWQLMRDLAKSRHFSWDVSIKAYIKELYSFS